ncbi:methylated-DNA--[protein]-cysteine S-methyltransferase [Hydrogenophaga defluvii]|uniref:Methylated-DNA--protein-cysteine methyltransferase n=1 Tax=Hydrogenophaga defluvii TaxID=249410 RepID=A0ABW2SFY1_9BURK
MKNTYPVVAVARTDSPLGPLLLAASQRGLSGLWFEDQRHLPAWLANRTPAPASEHAVLHTTERQLHAYFAGERNDFDLPLDLDQGTDFQRAVWQALLTIPVRASLSYGALARQIGRPAAVRAVGAAVGRNPLGIIVPCHRVLGADGSLTGYAGGLWRKTALLRLELGHPPTSPTGATLELFS